MDKTPLITINNQLKNILGAKESAGYQDRLAAIQILVGNYTALLGMDDANRTASWTVERVSSAREFLIMAPWLGKLSSDILCRELAISMAKKHGKAEIIAYAEPLVRWALFDNEDHQKGIALATAHRHIGGSVRWQVMFDLLLIGIWNLQIVMPGLIGNQDFRESRLHIWSMIYSCYQNFSTRFPSLRDLEVPLPSPAERNEAKPIQRDLKIAIWSYKIGDYLSSITQVHPWLLKLQEPGLEVFILSERRTDDTVQKLYRQTFGQRFIDCDSLTNEAFLELTKKLDLDVVIPLHPSRDNLIEKHRLARCHLDTWADMAIHGVPDVTLASEGMLDSAFVASTGRKFIVIPDPPHVYSMLPPIELTERPLTSRFCFGAFNRALKMNPAVFDLWGRVLMECPNATLLVAFLQVDFYSEYILKVELGKRGVEPSRILIAPRVGHTEHLARHNTIDLMLDTCPLGAGMTAVDTFFMGVPLLSMNIDNRPAALHTNNAFFNVLGAEAGLSAHTTDDYVKYAKARYQEGPRNKARRQVLRDVSVRSPLFDGDGYMQLMRQVIRTAADNPPGQLVKVASDPRKK